MVNNGIKVLAVELGILLIKEAHSNVMRLELGHILHVALMELLLHILPFVTRSLVLPLPRLGQGPPSLVQL